MSKAFDRAKQLLDFLGTPVPRPKPERERLPGSNGVCKFCDSVVVWATAPSGLRMPFDVHPEGDWVIVAGNAVAYGPAHEGQRRYVSHFGPCKEKRGKR